ncbi:MAG: Dabb family protein [Ruminococcus sp.]|jgi:hypothetical protein|nr:Dabb family protein [Ruminococcus sp.]
MVKHILFLSVKSNYDHKEVLSTFTQMMLQLKKLIPEIMDFHIGENINPTSAYQICLDSEFKDINALNHYIYHPEHMKVREYLASVIDDKLTFDYIK